MLWADAQQYQSGKKMQIGTETRNHCIFIQMSEVKKKLASVGKKQRLQVSHVLHK